MARFAEEEVDVEALSGCAEEDLLAMGVAKLGHRKKLIKSYPFKAHRLLYSRLIDFCI